MRYWIFPGVVAVSAVITIVAVSLGNQVTRWQVIAWAFIGGSQALLAGLWHQHWWDK